MELIWNNSNNGNNNKISSQMKKLRSNYNYQTKPNLNYLILF